MSYSRKKKTVTLSVTHMCNLKCCYCYEIRKDRRKIDIETGKAIIEKELNSDSEFTEIEFSFFGGEPFTAFHEIRELYSFAKQLSGSTGKTVTFSAITNGTLLTDEMKEWLREHSEDFVVTLSIDGIKSMHDMNRSNSFDKIDVDFFLKTYTPAYAKMTVSELTLSSMAEGIIYLVEKGFKVACNLAYGIKWTSDNFTELETQLDHLVKYYSHHYPKREICSMLEFPFMEIYRSYITGSIYSCCSAGREACAYDIDGAMYPCHMFFPINSGRKIDKATIELCSDNEVNKNLLPEKCVRCPIASVCQQCYGSNWIESGNIYRVAEEVCRINKITFRAKARLAAELWNQGKLCLKPEEEMALLQSLLLLEAL